MRRKDIVTCENGRYLGVKRVVHLMIVSRRGDYFARLRIMVAQRSHAFSKTIIHSLARSTHLLVAQGSAADYILPLVFDPSMHTHTLKVGHANDYGDVWRPNTRESPVHHPSCACNHHQE